MSTCGEDEEREMQHAKGESVLCRAWIIKNDEQGNEHSSRSINKRTNLYS